MSRARRIAELANLAAIRREVELAALSRASEARREAEARLAEIDAERAGARGALAGDDAATLGAAANRFERWALAERARRNMELARVTAEWMDRRAVAARAHGQNEVLDRLAERARAEARAQAERRRIAAQPPDLAPPRNG